MGLFPFFSFDSILSHSQETVKLFPDFTQNKYPAYTKLSLYPHLDRNLQMFRKEPSLHKNSIYEILKMKISSYKAKLIKTLKKIPNV